MAIYMKICFNFLVKIKDIYKTKLGSAVIEILVSHQQIEAREMFMTNYFNNNRKTLKRLLAIILKMKNKIYL